jgi:hypothetical protein
LGKIDLTGDLTCAFYSPRSASPLTPRWQMLRRNPTSID